VKGEAHNAESSLLHLRKCAERVQLLRFTMRKRLSHQTEKSDRSSSKGGGEGDGASVRGKELCNQHLEKRRSHRVEFSDEWKEKGGKKKETELKGNEGNFDGKGCASSFRLLALWA